MFDRYEWVQMPNGEYILIDTWTNEAVKGVPSYRAITTTSTETFRVDYL